MKAFWQLRGSLAHPWPLVLEVAGFVGLIAIWQIVVWTGWVPPSLLPPPWKVITAFPELHFEDALVRNLGFSIFINFAGYLEAICIAVPLGFIIGLFPICRELAHRYIDALRYLPLTAITGLFIAWFGIDTNMKIQFLAFGIVVYLLPVVIQRIQEIESVYVDTLYTLGATSWQTIWHVFVPAVAARISDDARVLVAISWTYIIVAELVNKSEGGIGALAFTCARQSRIDKVFAILLVIILVGFLQDRFAKFLDKAVFPHKC